VASSLFFDTCNGQVFDTATQKWSTGPAHLWSRESFAVGEVGTKIFIVGGQTDDGNEKTLKKMLVFDTATQKVPSHTHYCINH
jgi:hypothetical protein